MTAILGRYKPRHTEFVYKLAAELDKGDVLPLGRYLSVTVDYVTKRTHYRPVVGWLHGRRLGWLALGLAPRYTVVEVTTQNRRIRTLRGRARVKLISPTTGQTLMAKNSAPVSVPVSLAG